MIKSLLVAAVLASPAVASDDCSYVSGSRYMYFVHTGSVVVVVDRDYRDLPYVCTTATLGTGIVGRALTCSDGYSGALKPDTGTTLTFRDAEWTDSCPDNTPMDIEMGN